MPGFEERIARNEALFRHVNEEVQALARRFGVRTGEVTGFVCECGHEECTDRIDVPLDVYERVRGNPRRFLVLPGHVLPEIEHVVEETDDWVVVEKDTETAIRVTERHDPRGRAGG